MSYLLDTNILLRTLQLADPEHAVIRTALRKLREQGEDRAYLSQNLVEFWNVCTRPATVRGGHGFTVIETDRGAKLLERLFTLLPDSPAIHTEWRRIVVAHNV